MVFFGGKMGNLFATQSIVHVLFETAIITPSNAEVLFAYFPFGYPE